MIQKSAESGFCGVLGGGEKTQVRLNSKRKYVLSETQVRLE